MIIELCVVLTLTALGGFMVAWGVHLDTTTSVFVIITLGLTVDYSVHVTHVFVSESDPGHTRDQRVRRVLVELGPAVLSAGVSTFLSFMLLVMVWFGFNAGSCEREHVKVQLTAHQTISMADSLAVGLTPP